MEVIEMEWEVYAKLYKRQAEKSWYQQITAATYAGYVPNFFVFYTTRGMFKLVPRKKP